MTEEQATSLHLDRPGSAPALYSQDGRGYGATVHAHYFMGTCDWLVTEYDPDDDLAFGWACLGGDRQNAELGYVSLAELEQIKVPLRVRFGERTVVIGHHVVERDADWPSGLTITEAIALLDTRQGRG
jgi:Protein of unknown function (DUF2958)